MREVVRGLRVKDWSFLKLNYALKFLIIQCPNKMYAQFESIKDLQFLLL